MTTRKKEKSATIKYLESISGGPLTLQKLVEAIRLGEEWTKREMAETIGVSPTYYSDFVAGKKPVSAQKAASWAKKLGYSESQFIKYAIDDQLKRQKLSKYEVEILLSS